MRVRWRRPRNHLATRRGDHERATKRGDRLEHPSRFCWRHVPSWSDYEPTKQYAGVRRYRIQGCHRESLYVSAGGRVRSSYGQADKLNLKSVLESVNFFEGLRGHGLRTE